MSGFCVRIDRYDGYEERIATLALSGDYSRILSMEHEGSAKENKHWHLVITTQVEMQAFRKRMKKIFDKGKGNGHMSIVPWDGSEKSLSYLFHEDSPTNVSAPNVNKGYSQDDVSRFRSQNIVVQDLVKKAKGKASYLLEDEVVKILQAKGGGFNDREVAKHILRCALDTGKYLPSDFMLKSMVDKIQYKLANGDLAAQEFVIENILSRIFKFS